ncbi:MAG: electron transport complex subunit RsxC [Alistipes sp.]|jgi:electron transport complex protein RnfC|nr:electron transport complex subunit RsxC [Alistipes sp.]MBQ5785795.1 electron transport complex subunit RsxC [Alistipes sp.]MEE1102716.1 electron transport complex subunit RsxC [Alistipes sp.]
MKTFPVGGVHPSDNKQWSNAKAIEVLELPDVVNIPLGQHIGAPATAKVAKGDKVLTGQLIAEATGFMSANIHSPISGTVTAVDMQPNGQGLRQMMITIKREGDEWMPEIDRSKDIKRECELDSQAIISKIKDAGIVGMGGATFPTHVKLSIPNGCKAEYLIINGVECEPYLTSDHRNMLERGEELLIGVEILKKALNVEHAVVGVENNKPDAIENLNKIIANGKFDIKVEPLKVQYPQGGEKQLIAAVTGREVPPPPGLPIHVGAVVCNASTALAVYEAVQKNKPLIERVVTITGKDLQSPRNLLTRMGTPISKLIEMAGGLPEGDVKVVNGGPMMGRAMVNLDSAVTKGCSGVTVYAGVDAHRVSPSPCIKCAKCVAACPMSLEPYLISKLAKKQMWERLEQENIVDCIECGCCQFTCPAGLPLLDYVRYGKQTVMGIIRSRAAAAAKK